MSRYIPSKRRLRLFAGFLLTITALFTLGILSTYFNEKTNENKDLLASKIDQIISENPTASGIEEPNTYKNDNKIDKSILDLLK